MARIDEYYEDNGERREAWDDDLDGDVEGPHLHGAVRFICPLCRRKLTPYVPSTSVGKHSPTDTVVVKCPDCYDKGLAVSRYATIDAFDAEYIDETRRRAGLRRSRGKGSRSWQRRKRRTDDDRRRDDIRRFRDARRGGPSP